MSLHAVVLNRNLNAFKLISMMRLKGAVTFLLFLTLFVWPVFEIFDKETFIVGMPLPVIYIFTIWVLSVIVAYKGGK
ncbi:MAG: hypothetical protein M1470_15050 [Bacteroidetes bacterium]|nr:hypothetical protein [Bacteroidota bacterium]MCL5738649.1 hypothetical protein [Bacteroidota bacterium]